MPETAVPRSHSLRLASHHRLTSPERRAPSARREDATADTSTFAFSAVIIIIVVVMSLPLSEIEGATGLFYVKPVNLAEPDQQRVLPSAVAAR